MKYTQESHSMKRGLKDLSLPSSSSNSLNSSLDEKRIESYIIGPDAYLDKYIARWKEDWKNLNLTYMLSPPT